MKVVNDWRRWLMPLILSLDGQDLTRVIRQGPEEPGHVGVSLMLKLARNEIPAGLRICRLPDRLSTPLAVLSALLFSLVQRAAGKSGTHPIGGRRGSFA
jgi:hypothetical protein